jgi:hypothetical protein
VAQRKFEERGRQGQSNSGHGAPLRRHWAAAERAFVQAETAEAAWGRVRSALDLFTPEGRLNSRPQAEAVVAAALPDLKGAAWAKVRRLLSRPESFTFLDQAARRLAELGLEEATLSALLDLEGLRRQPWRGQGSTPVAAAVRGVALARVVQLEKTSPEWRDQASEVNRVLRGVWRASSLVECLNSVARMQQSRHRKMTQGLLDLKRLYWNLRRFRTGQRKDQTPYGLLGLKIPDLSFWEFLKLTPEQLREQLSATEHARRESPMPSDLVGSDMPRQNEKIGRGVEVSEIRASGPDPDPDRVAWERLASIYVESLFGSHTRKPLNAAFRQIRKACALARKGR